MATIQATALSPIAQLNDRFRKGDLTLGRVCATQLVQALSREEQKVLFRLVRAFDDFTPENDSYGEHDFGSVEFQGEKYFFKIDYYDKSLEYGSDDPSNPKVTTRVLTLMHSSEY